MRRAKKLYAAVALALVATMLAATVAVAAVTFDPDTGKGFVGKGDVQLAFGWNDKQLQTNASGVSFSYNTNDEYQAVCEWITGEGTKGQKTHQVSHKKKTTVNSEIAYENRTNPKSKITGFNLLGYGATEESGEIPVEGASCPGNEGHEGTWSSVTKTGSTGGLYALHGTNQQQLN